MSKEIIVLAPNGRRYTVHCTPDTSILQVLEDVCKKQGFEANEYSLKHHNHLVDLTTTIRFSNLPNRACLEMVEAEQRREESNVTVALVLEDGERITAEFPPSTNLYDLVFSLAASTFGSLHNPSVQYMRQEVVGIDAMKEKTLRQLGLIQGRAIIRLLNKSEKQTQANVSAVYNVKPKEVETKNLKIKDDIQTQQSSLNPLKLLKEAKAEHGNLGETDNNPETTSRAETKAAPSAQPEGTASVSKLQPMDVDVPTTSHITNTSRSSIAEENLERRLKIEDEVYFVGSQKAIVFKQPETPHAELVELPDEFYELSVEEVRRLQRELSVSRARLENAPLTTRAAHLDLQHQNEHQQLNTYKNAVVRIQFPDHMVLQGIFLPTNTIHEVTDFIKLHLATPEKSFLIFTTPIQNNLDQKMTLAEAKFVPCVHMHFKWLNGDTSGPYLREEIYLKQTPSDAASILASKYRAPTRRKEEEAGPLRPQPAAGTSKVPKWFKK